MIVLGITDGITCGAAVVVDGVIVSAVNEERLTRMKMAYGVPRASIREVLELAGVEPRDVDLVAIDTERNYLSDGVREFNGWFGRDKGLMRDSVFSTVARFGSLAEFVPGLEALYYRMRKAIFAQRRRRLAEIVREEFGIQAPVKFVNHHLAHAASAYFTSGFDDATVVTMDGGGDGSSSHVYWVREGHFRLVSYTSAYNSLGNYYAYATHVCGFTAQKHEGKITGLAAHGDPIYLDLLNRLITYRNGRIDNCGRAVFRGAVKKLTRMLSRQSRNWGRADLAASVQAHCEDIAARYVWERLNPDGDGNLALAGGVFANVRINQRLHELDGVERIFIHPAMTDAGLAVGAALAACVCGGKLPHMQRSREVLQTVYLGREFTERQIEQALRDAGIEFTRCAQIEEEIARLLADGYVVARLAGRMEYGPRALGNRSILYQPCDPSVNDWLNARMRRTEFMPFAPLTLMEYADQCYYGTAGAIDAARFMTITFDCTDWMKETCPGVVHLDGTARPQLVDRRDNPSVHQIIAAFRRRTGLPSVINTSFNLHEEPIVHSPQDALRVFRLGNLDYLAMGNFLARSPQPIHRPLRPVQRVEAPAVNEESTLVAAGRM